MSVEAQPAFYLSFADDTGSGAASFGRPLIRLKR
jgi:hypothetical protein